MAIDKSLVSGSMTMLLLKLLEEKDMYGYEMIETLRERSNNVFELKAGTLYPLLHSLEEKGLLLHMSSRHPHPARRENITASRRKDVKFCPRKRRSGRSILRV